jgi:SAM-dependent methyltransferase
VRKILYVIRRVTSARAVFTEVYEKNMWGVGGEFYSGRGSYGQSAKGYGECIINFIKSNNIKSVVDLGCGDFAVGKLIVSECEHYVGVDVVPSLIAQNRSMFTAQNVEFECLDVTKDSLPDAQLCLIRQVMQHLSNAEIVMLLEKIKKYAYVIVAEHQPEIDGIPNIDIAHGASTRTEKYGSADYLDKPPFCAPIKLLAETGFDTHGGRLRIFQLLT